MARRQLIQHKSSSSGLTSQDTIKINVSGTKYTVVSSVARELGLTIVKEDMNDCDVYWIDGAVPLEKFLEMKHHQKINHFPGMGEICRKDSLGRNMQRMRRENRDEYNFVPQTWVLPGEYNGITTYIRDLKRRRRTRTFILKPPNGSMGNGISLTRSIEDIPRDQNLVVQEYIDKPLLLDGFKLDLRVYVLVTSCNPLRIFVYKDGLVRLSTQPYTPPTDDNLQKQFMHLTNYSINKHSESFDPSDEHDKGSKRTIKYFNGWLVHNGYNVAEMWAKIYDVVIKTLIVAQPSLVHSYNACRPGRGADEKCQYFEILGFDILLDRRLNPWVLEVNRSPSFGTDAQLDLDIKTGVIKDALNIINLNVADRKRSISAHKMASRRRLLVTPSKALRYDFLGEQEEADYKHKKKKAEVKEQLLLVRRLKALNEHEDSNIGDYVRIYPTTDWRRAGVYDTLLESASRIGLTGKSVGQGIHSRRGNFSSSLQRLKEHELLDLLTQYEDQHPPTGLSQYTTGIAPRPSTSSTHLTYQPLSVQDSCSPMDSMYAVMAARVAEEEQAQRTMMALNETKPSYPLKTAEEVKKVLDEINADIVTHRPNIASFWMVTLDSTKRKQLLAPLKDSVKSLLQTYSSRALSLESVKLYQVLNKLFSFLLSRGGKGLWSAFVPLQKSWEADFREKSETLSMTEIVCCRKLVELCQSTLIAGYYFHHYKPSQSKTTKSHTHRPSTIPKCPSLPTIRQPPLSNKQRSYSHAGITPSPYKPPSTALGIRRSDFRPFR